MLAVLFIAVVLLQFSSTQETIENDPELQKLDTAPILNESVEENLIKYIPPTSTDISKKTDEIPVSDTKEVQNKEEIQPINTIIVNGPANAKGAVTISTCYGREDSCSSEINEETSDEERPDDNKTIINTTIKLSNPVKTDGKIVITAQFECETTDGRKEHKDTSKVVLNSNDEVATEVSDEPITYNGCAKGQGKVTIAADYGCGGNTIDFGKNPVTNQETDNKAVGNEEIQEESVSFGGTVPVQGKISIGTHYGCGGPVEMPPMPWFPTYYPQFYAPPPYFIPGLLAEYPAIPDVGPIASSEVQEQFDSRSEAVNKNEDMNFNGVVPVRGTVSIAAKY